MWDTLLLVQQYLCEGGAMGEENRERWPRCVHCRNPVDLENDDYQTYSNRGVTDVWHTEPCKVKETQKPTEYTELVGD